MGGSPARTSRKETILKQYYEIFTPNCPACKALAKYLATRSDIEIIYIDATEDKNREILEKYNIHSVPALVDIQGDRVMLGFRKDLVESFLST